LNERSRAALLATFESIQEQAKYLLEAYSLLDSTSAAFSVGTFGVFDHGPVKPMEPARQALYKQSTAILSRFNQSLKEVREGLGMRLRRLDLEADQAANLRILLVECSKVLSVLSPATLGSGTKAAERLKPIRKEAQSVCTSLDIGIWKNVELSIAAAGRNEFLASSLITGRVVDWVLNQIPERDIEGNAKAEAIDKKVNYLVFSGLVEAGRKDLKGVIFKANQKARDLSSHDIHSFPSYSETHSLLNDCIQILKVYKSYVEAKKTAQVKA